MRLSWHLAVLLGLLLAGCSATPTIQVPETDHVLVPVFYATDRDQGEVTSSSVPFGSGRGALTYGRLEVSIPRSHVAGRLEEPDWWRFESSPDPGKHILLRSVTILPEVAFHDRLRSSIAAASGEDAFVFVHGFNVGFSEAARRTAQLAYDLGFKGVPILYSWPSQADATLYAIDSTNADWTAWHFEAFLKGLAARSGASRIHIISHSLGSKVVVAALENIARSLNSNGPPPVGQVILCAPDVDRDIFQRAAPGMLKAASRSTRRATIRRSMPPSGSMVTHAPAT